MRVGRVGRSHGIHGELYLDPNSLTPDELLAIGTFEWRGKAGVSRPLTLRSAKPANVRLLVTFADVNDVQGASALTNGELWADAAKLPDPGPGVAYTFQMVGLRVVTTDGRDLGEVSDVLMQTGKTLYVVRGDRERLIPGHEPFLKHVDLEAGRITVELPEGFEAL